MGNGPYFELYGGIVAVLDFIALYGSRRGRCARNRPGLFPCNGLFLYACLRLFTL